MYGGAGGQVGRRLVQFAEIVTPAAAPPGVWTATGGWWQVPGPAILHRLKVILPPGVAGVLWLRPVYREASRPEMIYDLPAYAAGLNGYITGDGMDLSLELREGLNNRHQLGVLAQHTGAINHAYAVIYELELGGDPAHGAGAS